MPEPPSTLPPERGAAWREAQRPAAEGRSRLLGVLLIVGLIGTSAACGCMGGIVAATTVMGMQLQAQLDEISQKLEGAP